MHTDSRMAEEFDRWGRYQSRLSYTIWDIDHFSKVNDSFGHKAGDRALQALAQIVKAQIRESDFLARIGDEEFIILFPDTDVTRH
jgi:diguanylate cyclase